MSVAAAIRITSPDEARVIEHAVAFAKQQAESCFIISVVPSLPHGAMNDDEQANVARNLNLIMESQCVPVMQEGDDIAQTLLTVARGFGIRTLFLQNGTSRGRSIAEQLLYLDPPFDVVVVGNSA
jgi:hypothetical protein